MEQWKVEMSKFKEAVENIAKQVKRNAESLRRYAFRPIIDEREYTVYLRGHHARAILEHIYGADVEDQIRAETPVDPDCAHYEEEREED